MGERPEAHSSTGRTCKLPFAWLKLRFKPWTSELWGRHPKDNLTAAFTILNFFFLRSIKIFCLGLKCTLRNSRIKQALGVIYFSVLLCAFRQSGRINCWLVVRNLYTCDLSEHKWKKYFERTGTPRLILFWGADLCNCTRFPVHFYIFTLISVQRYLPPAKHLGCTVT